MKHTKIFTLSVISALLVACGGGGGGGGGQQDTPAKNAVNPSVSPVPPQALPVKPPAPIPSASRPQAGQPSPQADPNKITVTLYKHKDNGGYSGGTKFEEKEKVTVNLTGKDYQSNDKENPNNPDYYFAPLGDDFSNGHIGFMLKPNSGNDKLEPKLELVVKQETLDHKNLADLTARFFEYGGFLWVEKKAQYASNVNASNGNTELLHVGDIDLDFKKGKLSEHSKVYDHNGSKDPLFDITGSIKDGVIFEPTDNAHAVAGIHKKDKGIVDNLSFIGEQKNPTAVAGKVGGEGWEAVFKAGRNDNGKPKP